MIQHILTEELVLLLLYQRLYDPEHEHGKTSFFSMSEHTNDMEHGNVKQLT